MSATDQKRKVMGAEPPKAVKPPDRTDQMSFLEHLEELRWRIIKGFIGIIVGVVISFVFSDFVIDKCCWVLPKPTFLCTTLLKWMPST